MVSKPKKSDFLANFATERQFLRPLLGLMLLQRGKFYSFKSDLDVAECPDENLLIAWLEAAEEDDGYRSIVCLDPRDLWTGYALIHYPTYLERQAESLNRIH